MDPGHKNLGFSRRLGFAVAGLGSALRGEASIRTQAAAAAALLVLLATVRPAPVWWAILLLAAGLVLALELVNTAVEALCDHLHPDQHPALKRVKDMLAGAVLVASLVSLAVFAAFLAEIAL